MRQAIARRHALAFAALADYLGIDVEAAARAVLDCATDKVIPTVEALIKEYELDEDQRLLIGEGGGAAALIPHVSARTGLAHEISRDAEVISSIGVALALVRDVVERIIPHPQPDDLLAIRREALEAVVRLGADPAGVDVTVEIDQQTHRVRATAMGAAEMHVKDASGAISAAEARAVAARSLGIAAAEAEMVAASAGIRVYQPQGEGPRSVRAVDWTGALRVQRSRAIVQATSPEGVGSALPAIWKEATREVDGLAVPGLVMLHGRHLVDLSGVEDVAQAVALATMELTDQPTELAVVLIAMPPGHPA